MCIIQKTFDLAHKIEKVEKPLDKTKRIRYYEIQKFKRACPVDLQELHMNAAICTTRFTSFGYPRYFMAWDFSACNCFHCDASECRPVKGDSQ